MPVWNHVSWEPRKLKKLLVHSALNKSNKPQQVGNVNMYDVTGIVTQKLTYWSIGL